MPSLMSTRQVPGARGGQSVHVSSCTLRVCFQKRALYPYFQVFPSWEARAPGEGGACSTHGERGPKKAKSEDGGGGGGP